MKSGIVFSIEEFSTYDGPGIRSTVFLKGCPLRCTWCHNPEGQEFAAEVVRSLGGCLHCGACLSQGERQTGSPSLVPASVSVCPRGLVRMCGEVYSSDDLVKKILKNADLLNAGDGGVTFSGGEPLSQHKFLLACLTALRGRIHRALQTTGYASSDVFASVLTECDYVLYDIKLMDDAMHKRFTGVSNRLILENFALLTRSNVPFIPRIPLIPQVTDTEENITAIASFLFDHGVHHAELLPYNKMAGGKYAILGRRYEPNFDESAEVQIRRDLFERYHVEVTVL